MIRQREEGKKKDVNTWDEFVFRLKTEQNLASMLREQSEQLHDSNKLAVCRRLNEETIVEKPLPAFCLFVAFSVCLCLSIILV